MSRHVVCRYSYQIIDAPSPKAACDLADAHPERGASRSFVVNSEDGARKAFDLLLMNPEVQLPHVSASPRACRS